MAVTNLDPNDPIFPNPNYANQTPEGLLAIGGNLAPNTLLTAYRMGIFPWYMKGDPILWWSPATRCVIDPHNPYVSKSLKKQIRKTPYQVTSDQVFEEVVENCSEINRGNSHGTWINCEMRKAYYELFTIGVAHSVEIWLNNELAGGLYGLAVGGVFSGESMFSKSPNVSKIALLALCNGLKTANFCLIDCQIVTPHLKTLGANSIDRHQFLEILSTQINRKLDWPEDWTIP